MPSLQSRILSRVILDAADETFAFVDIFLYLCLRKS